MISDVQAQWRSAAAYVNPDSQQYNGKPDEFGRLGYLDRVGGLTYATTIETRSRSYGGSVSVWVGSTGNPEFGNGTMIGKLDWFSNGVIDVIYVKDAYQRKGIATKMLKCARAHAPYPIKHSQELLDDGLAWAQSDPTWDGRHKKRGGPGSGVIPARVRTDPPARLSGPRRVVVDPVARQDILDLDQGEQKLVRRVLQAVSEGRQELERKTRPPLEDCVSADVTYQLRLLFFYHIDGSIHNFYAGPHDYHEAERRMEKAANANPRIHDTAFPTLEFRVYPGFGIVQAMGPHEYNAGTLSWYDDGEIKNIFVQPQWRRKGLATAMLRHARDSVQFVKIHHSPTLSDDGRAWSEKTASTPSGYKDHWNPGETGWFEYHCTEAHDSCDAEIWYRSHQQVTVLGDEDYDSLDELEGIVSTWDDRQDAGLPKFYKVRFVDGLHWGVCEDELSTTKSVWYRPDPPKKPGKTAMPTSWRPFTAEPFWLQHDVTISSEGGASGRKQYEIHVKGRHFANRPTLAAAQEAVEAEYGSLIWSRLAQDKMEVTHQYFGPSEEWTSPMTVWVASLTE